MSPVYLSQICLNEFRNFGSLTVDLPPTPGVMIVHGTNGLGKSSLFDGLEWALTGEIDHFKDWSKNTKERDYLRRWGAADHNPTEISLTFSDGKGLKRILPDILDPSCAITDVISYLRDDGWKQKIENLHRYLLLTHFLGQSTLSRMTHRKPEERWAFLEQPAQSDWALKLINTIHGPGQSNNAKAYDRRVTAYEERARYLNELLTTEGNEWAAAQVQGGLDDAAAEALINTIAASFASIASSLGSTPPERSGTIDTSIESLSHWDLQLTGQIALRRTNLDRARVFLERLHALEIDMRDNQLAADAAASALSETVTILASRQKERDDAEKAVTDLEAAVVAQRGNVDHLGQLHTAQNQVERWSTELASANAQVSQLKSEIATAKIETRRQFRRRNIIQNIDAKVSELSRKLEVQTRLSVAIAALKTSPALADLEQELSKTLRELEFERQNETRVDAEFSSLADKVKEARTALESASAAFGTISSAVAKIAENLSTSDCNCPVCATNFPAAGDLKGRATAALERLAPALAPFQSNLSNLQSQQAEAAQNSLNITAKIVALESKFETLQIAINNRNELITAIFGGQSEGAIEIIERQTTHQLESLPVRIAQLTYRKNLPVLIQSGDPFESWRLAVRKEAALEANLQSINSDIANLESEISAQRTRISTEIQPLGIEGDIASILATAELTLASLTGRLAFARQVLSTAVQAADQSQLLMDQSEATKDTMLQSVERAAQQITDYRLAWQSMDFLGQAIEVGVINRLDRELSETNAHLEVTRPQIGRLREGRAIWSKQTSHKDTLERLRVWLGAAPNLERTELRGEAERLVHQFNDRINAIRKAKTIGQDATTEVNRKVQTFNTGFLKPLNSLMSRINRAILSEPDIGLDLKVERKKISQTAIKSSDAPDYVSKLDPQLVHSEGQMAALAVSMLCAANISFPWSRWPALIMDDPLQHNDVIHAAAFADIMCNLVEARKQQIFVSTHDIAQAEFLRRKFSSRNIPCTSVHLLGRGRDGLEVQIKGYKDDTSFSSLSTA